jgi:hypothetical protein
MFKNLMKAAVGLVVETPLAMLEDTITMGGAVTGKDEPATVTALKKVAKNVAEATDPREREG